MYRSPKPPYLKLFLQIIPFLVFSFTLGQSHKNLALHSSVTHVQPMNGIVFWSDNLSALNELGNKCQLEFSYMVYSDIVSEKGVYNWSIVDALLEETASHERQAIIRFRYTYPGIETPSVPSYIRNRSDYTDQIIRIEEKSTYIPDWSNEELKNFTLEFFSEFAARYDKDPRLAYLQVGFGSYSEYHLYDGPNITDQTFPSKSYQKTFLQHLDGIFSNTSWSISIDASEKENTPIFDNPELKNLNYGLFDDSFLHKEHSESNNEYNRSSWLFFDENRSHTRVAGGEFNYHSDYDQKHALDLPTGPWGVSFEELSEKYHISYMVGNDQLRYKSKERIEEAGMNIGYHFQVNKFRVTELVTEVEITNIGIAPIYYDAYPMVKGVRSLESLKGLLKGESKVFTINAIADNEELMIDSDRLVAGQEIQFDANLEESELFVEEAENKVFIYPNPFTNKLIIKKTKNNQVEILLFDLLGKKNKSVIVNTIDHEINTSELQNGIYFIKILENGIIINTDFFVKK